MTVVDTPGLGASERDDEATLNALFESDAALLVVSGLHPGGEYTVELGEWLRIRRRRVLLAVTRLDQVSDRQEAMTAATAVLRGVVAGQPIGVVPPLVLAALATPEGPDGPDDETRRRLADAGYDDLLERLQGDFLSGDAAVLRARAALNEVRPTIRPLQEAVTRRSSAVALERQDLMDAGEAARNRENVVVRPKARFVDGKIDDIVDVHVTEFIDHLWKAIEVFIDKLALGGFSASMRALRMYTKKGNARVLAELDEDFRSLVPQRDLEVLTNRVGRSVTALLEAEWGSIAVDLAPLVPERSLDITAVTKGIVAQAGTQQVLVGLGVLGAFVLNLSGPGGVLFDLATLIAARRGRRSKREERIAIEKREAHVRLRSQRGDLGDRLATYYRGVNAGIRESLCRKLAGESEQAVGRASELAAALKALEAAHGTLDGLLRAGEILGGLQDGPGEDR